MTITEIVQKQINEAMKARDAVRLSTLKMLSAELHNEKIAKQKDLTNDEEIMVVGREAKKRRDAIESYEKVGRPDRAEGERNELLILQEFLPAELADDELEKIVADTIGQIGAASMADMGKVMAAVKSKVGQGADGARVAAMVKSKLG